MLKTYWDLHHSVCEGEFLNDELMEVSVTDNLSDCSAEDHVIEESVVDSVIYAGINDEGTMVILWPVIW